MCIYTYTLEKLKYVSVISSRTNLAYLTMMHVIQVSCISANSRQNKEMPKFCRKTIMTLNTRAKTLQQI